MHRLRLICAIFVLGLIWFNWPSRREPAQISLHPPYFQEHNFLSKSHRLGAVSHHDARFVPDQPLTSDSLHPVLRGLLSSFTSSMEHLDIHAWIAHGTLLGWHWNRDFLPWDTDIDVQMTAADMARLVEYNMTNFTHASGMYLLDVNTYYSELAADAANRIDARWIDMENGKFIDITLVHEGDSLFCKDGHRYERSEIFPLSKSNLADESILIPAEAERILRKEYGHRALTNPRFHWHRFNFESKEWEPET